MQELARASAPHAGAIVATEAGLIAHQPAGAASCEGAIPMIESALRQDWSLDAARIACPVRIVWGTGDRLLPWPSAAVRYLADWLPHADWVELEASGPAPSSTCHSRPRS